MADKRYQKEDLSLKSNLNVYILGKHNLLKDIPMGKVNSLKNDDFENIEYGWNYEDIFSKNENNSKEMIKQNDLSEPFIIKSDSKEKLSRDKNFNNYEDNSKNNKNIILNLSYQSINSDFISKINFNYIDNLKLEEINTQINIDNKENVLIIFIDNITFINEVINSFHSIPREIHPLLLFIFNSKNIEKEKIGAFIKNKIGGFDIRNIYFLEEVDLNKEEKDNQKKLNNKIYLFLLNSWLYYNNLGDDFFLDKYYGNNLLKFFDINKNENNKNENNGSKKLFNILIIGNPSVGKSTLVNLLCNYKRSLEGFATKDITPYIIKKHNICLFDTPGFEDNKNINELINFIKKKQNNILKGNNQINLVFYLIKNNARDFYKKEGIILKTLFENDIPVFFLITHSKTLDKNKSFIKQLNINLKETFQKFDKNKGTTYFNNKIEIFPVNLLGEEDNSIKSFGLQNVMEKAYQNFKYCIIEKKELEELNNFVNNNYDDRKNIKLRLLEMIKGKEIYKNFIKIEDILNNLTSLSSTIKKYKFYAGFGSIIPILSYFVLSYIKKKTFSEISKYFTLDENEIKQIIEKGSVKFENGYFLSNFLIINIFYNIYALNEFYNHCIKEYSEILKNVGLDGILYTFQNEIESYNNAINGLYEISQKYKE